MNFANKLKKAMVDKNIGSAKALASECDMSSFIVRRLLKNDGTCRINDLKIVALHLDVQFDIFGDK